MLRPISRAKPRAKSRPPQLGFTLLEMVIVIIILGILAASALPRLLNVSDGADKALISGTQGAFKEAVNIARSKWIAIGAPTDMPSRNDVQLSGSDPKDTIDFNRSGWPAQHWLSSDSKLTTDNVDDCLSVWEVLLNTGGDDIADKEKNDTIKTFQASYPAEGICLFALTSNPALFFQYNSNTGAVTGSTD